jgi:hypothetical protein
MNPKLTGFITSRCYCASLFRTTAYDNGFASILWVIALLDGCVEGIYIYVNDFPLRVHSAAQSIQTLHL